MFICAVDFQLQATSASFFQGFFVAANWLPHGQHWAIIEGTASLTRC